VPDSRRLERERILFLTTHLSRSANTQVERDIKERLALVEFKQ
jgi:hypothetical protein